MAPLKEKFAEKLAPMQQKVRDIVKTHGDIKISDVSIKQAYGGARGVKRISTARGGRPPLDAVS